MNQKDYSESRKEQYQKLKKEHEERKPERNKYFIQNLEWALFNYRINNKISRKKAEQRLSITLEKLYKWEKGNEKISKKEFDELHLSLNLAPMYLFNCPGRRQCKICKVFIDDYPSNFQYCNYCFSVYNPLNYSSIIPFSSKADYENELN